MIFLEQNHFFLSLNRRTLITTFHLKQCLDFVHILIFLKICNIHKKISKSDYLF